MSQKIILLSFDVICMIVHLESKKYIVSHPVTSQQPHFAVQILMGHPVELKLLRKQYELSCIFHLQKL